MDETPATPRHPLGDAGEPQDLRGAPAFVRHHQTGAGFHSQPDVSYHKDDDDVRDSEANVTQSDRNYVRLMHSIHNRFTYSVPASAPREHPRWELGYVFSTSEVTSSAKPIMTLYPRVDEILDSYADRATRFARVKAFTSCTAVQAQGHSGRRSTGFLFGSLFGAHLLSY